MGNRRAHSESTAFFSFNGNKIITTSGGGMLVSDDEEKMKKSTLLDYTGKGAGSVVSAYGTRL